MYFVGAGLGADVHGSAGRKAERRIEHTVMGFGWPALLAKKRLAFRTALADSTSGVTLTVRALSLICPIRSVTLMVMLSEERTPIFSCR